LRVGHRLEDELHLRHLAERVLAEALDVGDGELAARAGRAAVVLPALQGQRVVDGLRRAADGGQRDVAGGLVRRQQVGMEEHLGEGRRRGLVDLAEAAAAPGHGAALRNPSRGAFGGGASTGCCRDRDRHSQDDQRDERRTLPSHLRLLPCVHRLTSPFERQLACPAVGADWGGGLKVRSHRPSSVATRSPETTIPARIAAPKTTYCIAAERPITISIWVRKVSASAAIQVDVALASPPESEAPAMTTAAIGASR